MRGNPYSRGFDPMKSRSERRKEKQVKLSKTKRVIRLKKRLGRIAARKFAGQEDSHMTALMESYISRRKAERAAAKVTESLQGVSTGPGEAMSSAENRGQGPDSYEDEDEHDTSSMRSVADSAFQVDNVDKYGDEDADGDDVPPSRRRAVPRKQGGRMRSANGIDRPHNREYGCASWSQKKEKHAVGSKVERNQVSRGGQRGRHVQNGRTVRNNDRSAQSHHKGVGSTRFHGRSPKAPTRSLY